ncbi:MAG TPA: sensor domain-containing diguanylate cyclase [Longimicrobiales bacterium]|jgi:diguanylate cyclase (GGDEF)-like protein
MEAAGSTTSRLAERYRALLDIGRTLAGTLSREELFRTIYRETAAVLEAAGFYISMYDQARDLATIVFYADRGQERRVEISYRGSDSEVIREAKPVLIDDRVDLRSLLVLGDESSEVTRAAISAPLLHKGRVLGAISAQSYEAGGYTQADLELLQGIADIAAVAVENAYFVAELERQRREAEQIEEIGRALTSSLDTIEVLAKVIESALALIQADGCTVWLIEDGIARVGASDGRIALPLGLEWRITEAVHQRLIAEKRPLVVEDLATSPLVPDDLREHLEAGSGLVVPLLVEGEVAGALSAGSRELRHFDDEDTRILNRLASQASVALENARLHSSLQALSLTDPLTGLPNRRHLQMHLSREVAAARRGRPMVVVLFDLDNFKGYNDSRGHLAGDDALRAFGQILADENRAMNLVARYGGDEFIAVLSESTAEGAEPYVRRVQVRVGADPILSPANITVSCGLAEFDPEHMSSMEDIIHAADDGLYARKAERPPKVEP